MRTPVHLKRRLYLTFLMLVASSTMHAQDWQEIDRIYNPADDYGRSVFTDGVCLLAGAPQDNDSGAVFLYTKNTSTKRWDLVKRITPDQPRFRSEFGTSVARSGDYIIVGAPFYEEQVHNQRIGAVYIFQRNQGGSNQWGQVASFITNDAEPEDSELGWSVSISGEYALAGESGSTRRVFLLDRSNGWQPTDTLRPAAEEIGRVASVAIDGLYAAIGDERATAGSGAKTVDNAGAVFIFEDLNNDAIFEEMAKVYAADAHMGDMFGYSVDLDGNNLAVGAVEHDYDADGNNLLSQSGAVYVFNADQGGTGNWGQVSKLVEDPREVNNHFGEVVSISGNYLLVACQYECEDAAGQDSLYRAGAGYIFQYEPSSNQWNLLQKIVPSSRSAYRYFGFAASMGGDLAFIGENSSYATLFRNYIQSKNISFATVGYTELIEMIIEAGNGDGRVVFVREGSSSAAQPQNTVDYNADPVFGQGDQIDGDPYNYCVYDGTEVPPMITGLDTGTVYTVTVSEYYLNEKLHKIYNLNNATGNPLIHRTLIDLSGVQIHVGELSLTYTTPEMQYSLNSTDGLDGTWYDCSEGITFVDFDPGDVYIRDRLNQSHFRNLLTIPAQAAAPAFSIDYIAESTVQVVPATIEYNFDNNFLSANLEGTGVPLDLVPDTTYYFRLKATATTLPSEIQTLLVPDRPSVPNFTIDYQAEETNEVIANAYEYAFSPDMSGATGGIFNPISLTPGEDVYIRQQATTSSFSGYIQHLDVPLRPAVPVVSLSDKNSPDATFRKSTDGSGERVSMADGYAFSTNGGSSWQNILDGTTVDATGNKHIIVRKNATEDSFKSLPTGNLDSDQPVATLLSPEGCTGPEDSIEVQSNIDNGTLYLILEGETQNSVSDFETAVSDSKGSKREISAANVPLALSTGGLVPGTYFAYAVNDLDSISERSSGSAALYENPVIDLGSDIIKCQDTEVTLDPGPGFSAYLWSYQDATSQTITVTDEDDYMVTVTDEHGCRASDSVSVRFNVPYGEERICVVTVDRATGYNVIVWEKSPGMGIEQYNIYREGTLIGTRAYGELSIFKDTLADPEVRPYLYTLSILDSCGNESAQSPYHKPLFLQFNGTEGGWVNLIWFSYEVKDGAIGFDSYTIYRGSDSISLAPLAGDIPIEVGVYKDKDPQAVARRYYYRVAGELITPCSASEEKKAGVGVYTHSLSNLDDNKFMTGTGNLTPHGLLRIYPNPVTFHATIEFPNPTGSAYSLSIRDLTGKRVYLKENIIGDQVVFSRGTLPPGLYLVELRGPALLRGRILLE